MSPNSRTEYPGVKKKATFVDLRQIGNVEGPVGIEPTTPGLNGRPSLGLVL
jgi:hypothetical protein